MNNYIGMFIIVLASTIILGCADQQPEELNIMGSDTLVQLVADMAEMYMDQHPEVDIVVTGGGSGTGIAALVNGEIDIADASRQMTSEEIETARQKGIEPWEFIIARDGLAVIVHSSNGVQHLTIDQIGSIYRGETTNWNQVGGADMGITLYGRQSTSGTYEFFLEHVVNWQQIEKQDYSAMMLNMEGNKAIVDAVIADKSGIGYVGIGYVTDNVNVIHVAQDETSDYITPLDEANIENGLYPITRPLYQYTSGKPDKERITYDFLTFELSTQGQQNVRNAGFYPVNADDRAQNQKKISMMEG